MVTIKGDKEAKTLTIEGASQSTHDERSSIAYCPRLSACNEERMRLESPYRCERVLSGASRDELVSAPGVPTCGSYGWVCKSSSSTHRRRNAAAAAAAAS